MSYQGFLNFYPANGSTGGNVVVPDSHTFFLDIFKDPAHQDERYSLVRLDQAGDVNKYCSKSVQMVLDPGDFMLWDSRVVHCSQGLDTSVPASVSMPGREMAPFARLVAYICMIPRCHITDPTVLQKRREMVFRGTTGPHRPDARLDERVQLEFSPGFCPPSESDARVWSLV